MPKRCESFLAANGLKPGNLAAVGFHGQTLLHRPGARAHACRSATARRSRRGSAFPSSMIFAPPTSPRAGRARRWRRSFIARWCGICGASAAGRGAQSRRRRQRDLYRRRQIDRLRYRARQRVARRFFAAAHRTAARHRRPQGRGRHGRRGDDRASDGASVLRRAAAEIARPQRFSRLGRRRARRHRHRERRRDAHRAHRGRGGARSCRICRARRKAGSSPAAARAIRR